MSSTTTRRLIVQIAGLMLAIGLLVVAVVLYSARAMDKSALSAQTELVDNAISERMMQSLSELRSVAWWDEAVTKSDPKQFDLRWLDLEIGVFMTQSFHHDRVMILDEDDRPVYGFSGDGRADPATLSGDVEVAEALIGQVRGGVDVSPRISDPSFKGNATENSKFSNRLYGRSAAAVVKDRNGGELVSVMAITPSVDMRLLSPRPRLLVTFIKLDNAFWATAGRQALISHLGDERPGDRRDARFLLKSDRGETIGVLRWTSRKPGLVMIQSVLPLVLLGLAMLTAIVSILARRLGRATKVLADWGKSAEHLANHDALTGLPNRRRLGMALGALETKVACGEIQLAFACIDIDQFKDINDTLGHPTGDELICQVATRLREGVAGTDLVARLGGDEFAILRQWVSDDELDELMARISGCFAHPFDVQNQLITVNASVGLALSTRAGSLADLMRQADIALYEAKDRGRGRAIRFEPAMAEKIEQRRALEVDLRRAIGLRQIGVVYQPIIDSASGRIVSVEALARWHSPRHGEVSPAVFVSIAEEVGLMTELGRLVIERAVVDCRRWPGVRIAINISASQLASATIIEDLISPIARHNIDPSNVVLEVTESVLLENNAHIIGKMNDLKDYGFILSIDDFGTGFSSLCYIREFPFDQIKVDRGFISGITTSGQALSIVQAVVNFGRILDKDVVAEGIETDAEMQLMLGTGCTHMQGYLFARPMPAAEVEQLVRAADVIVHGGELAIGLRAG